MTAAELVIAHDQPVVDKVRVLQDRYSVSFRVSIEQFNPTVWAALFGSPLAWLAHQARQINPHWYLEGEQ